MSNQPEALRMANSLAAHSLSRHGQTQAARLLREQHAEIERLRAEREEEKVWRHKTLLGEAQIAFEHADELRRLLAEIERLRAEQLPTPPEECQTEAEKKAFAFGYWSGVAAIRARGEKP